MIGLASYKLKVAIGSLIVAAIVVSLSGAYLKGRADGSALSDARVLAEKQKWEQQVADLQLNHQQEVSGVLRKYDRTVSQFRNEIARLSDNPKVVEKFINRYVPIETQCTIPNGFVDLHNTAASGSKLSEAPVDASKPTDRTLQDVGGIVARNYYQCNEVMARLEALQQIVIKFQQQQKGLIK